MRISVWILIVAFLFFTDGRRPSQQANDEVLRHFERVTNQRQTGSVQYVELQNSTIMGPLPACDDKTQYRTRLEAAENCLLCPECIGFNMTEISVLVGEKSTTRSFYQIWRGRGFVTIQDIVSVFRIKRARDHIELLWRPGFIDRLFMGTPRTGTVFRALNAHDRGRNDHGQSITAREIDGPNNPGQHTRAEQTNQSPFLSTTKSRYIANHFAGAGNDYRVVAVDLDRIPNRRMGVDFNNQRNVWYWNNPFAYEHEISIYNEIPTDAIKGVFHNAADFNAYADTLPDGDVVP